MALRNKSLFLYGYEVTTANRSLDFRTTSGGPIRQATLTLGSYSATTLIAEIKRAMSAADASFVYFVTLDRSISSGQENRLTIATSGVYLDLLFSSGPRASSSCASLLGFALSDRTGATSYTGTISTGIILISELVAYNYIPPSMMNTVFGSLNVTASGIKEAMVWAIQKFFQVEFRLEPESKVILQWSPFFQWAIQQKYLEFTPDITAPSSFFECTLESTQADGKGMGFKFDEMLPDNPFFYKTGLLKFRQRTA